MPSGIEHTGLGGKGLRERRAGRLPHDQNPLPAQLRRKAEIMLDHMRDADAIYETNNK